jgi:hypothetical protein
MRSVSHTDEGEPLGFQTFIESTSPFPPIDFSIGALEHHGPRLPHFRSDPFFGNETCCLPIYNADRPRRSVPDNISGVHIAVVKYKSRTVHSQVNTLFAEGFTAGVRVLFVS